MQTPLSFNDFYRQLSLRKVPFFVVFTVTVFATYGLLYAIDFIPEPVAVTNQTATTTPSSTTDTHVTPSTVTKEATTKVGGTIPVQSTTAATQPLKIIFDTLDNKTVTVLNPTSDNEAVLDQALLSGAVHHPDSADFSSPGNIFILGHSSYLPNVINKNYQAFNGIQKLAWGDHIRVQSATTEYVYRVEKVYEAKASDVVVPATPGVARLTLATCNVLAAKEDRYIVEATLISQSAL